LTWIAGIVLVILVVGFAYAADQWHQRALFWQEMYLEKEQSLNDLLDGVDLYLDEGVVRVWEASQN